MCVLFTITTTAIKGTATQHQQQQQHLMYLPNCLPTHLHALLLQSIPFFAPFRYEKKEEKSICMLRRVWAAFYCLCYYKFTMAQMFSTLFADADVC